MVDSKGQGGAMDHSKRQGGAMDDSKRQGGAMDDSDCKFQINIPNTIDLYKVTWFQVFQSNTMILVHIFQAMI